MVPLIVYPHQKGYPNWPYPIRRIRDHFSETLFENLSRDSNNKFHNLRISIGYSFRDDYIVQMIRDVAREDDHFLLMTISPNGTKRAVKLFLKDDGTEMLFNRRIIPISARIEDILPELPGIIKKLEHFLGNFSNFMGTEFPGNCNDILESFWIEKALEYFIRNLYERIPPKEIDLQEFVILCYKTISLHSIIYPEKRDSRGFLIKYLDDVITSLETHRVVDSVKNSSTWNCESKVKFSVDEKKFEVILSDVPKNDILLNIPRIIHEYDVVLRSIFKKMEKIEYNDYRKEIYEIKNRIFKLKRNE